MVWISQWENSMTVRVVLEFIDVNMLAIAGWGWLVISCEHHANVRVFILRLRIFGPFSPASFHASIVVSYHIDGSCASNDKKSIVCDNIRDFGTNIVVSGGNGLYNKRFNFSSYLILYLRRFQKRTPLICIFRPVLDFNVFIGLFVNISINVNAYYINKCEPSIPSLNVVQENGE